MCGTCAARWALRRSTSRPTRKSRSKALRINAGFQSSLLIAAAIHLFIFSIFLFTFSNLEAPSRPDFVFLGSFLRAQDVALSSSEKPDAQAVVDIRNVNLDIRNNFMPRNLDKPSLAGGVTRSMKRQFKPLMEERTLPSKRQEDVSDLGIDLGPLVPVKLRMEQ